MLSVKFESRASNLCSWPPRCGYFRLLHCTKISSTDTSSHLTTLYLFCVIAGRIWESSTRRHVPKLLGGWAVFLLVQICANSIGLVGVINEAQRFVSQRTNKQDLRYLAVLRVLVYSGWALSGVLMLVVVLTIFLLPGKSSMKKWRNRLSWCLFCCISDRSDAERNSSQSMHNEWHAGALLVDLAEVIHEVTGPCYLLNI
jgi:hypothetical protein